MKTYINELNTSKNDTINSMRRICAIFYTQAEILYFLLNINMFGFDHDSRSTRRTISHDIATFE